MGLDFMKDTTVIAGMGTAFTVVPRYSGDRAYSNTVDADDRRTQLSPHCRRTVIRTWTEVN